VSFIFRHCQEFKVVSFISRHCREFKVVSLYKSLHCTTLNSWQWRDINDAILNSRQFPDSEEIYNDTSLNFRQWRNINDTTLNSRQYCRELKVASFISCHCREFKVVSFKSCHCREFKVVSFIFRHCRKFKEVSLYISSQDINDATFNSRQWRDISDPP
jgi:hypothetical protein